MQLGAMTLSFEPASVLHPYTHHMRARQAKVGSANVPASQAFLRPSQLVLWYPYRHIIESHPVDPRM